MERASRGFREGLRRELPAWRAEGLVTDETARALATRYDLASVEAGGPSFLAVYVLGALLVGAGVVSLVAWHWEAMSAPAKLATLAVAMIAAHGAGFALWRGGRSQRLGHALTVLGTLVFGASIGLVAQIFHVSGAWWGAFGAFTLGALAAALLYESLPHLLLSAIAGLWLFGPGLANDHAFVGVALGVLPLLAAATAALAVGLRRDDVDPLARGEAMLLGATVIAIGAGLSLEAGRGAVVVANLALAFLAIGRIVRGLSWLARGPFWEGMAVAGVVVASRFLEIETRLWLKGAATSSCGASRRVEAPQRPTFEAR